MGIKEFIDFIDAGDKPQLPPPIGWGIPGLPWAECTCEMCNTLQTLSRPEIAFIINRLREEYPEALVSFTLTIQEGRRQLLAQ